MQESNSKKTENKLVEAQILMDANQSNARELKASVMYESPKLGMNNYDSEEEEKMYWWEIQNDLELEEAEEVPNQDIEAIIHDAKDGKDLIETIPDPIEVIPDKQLLGEEQLENQGAHWRSDC